MKVIRSGSGSRRVIFVHGVLGTGRSFNRVAAHLTTECEMEWYDRRGYGMATCDDPPGIEGHAQDLMRIIGERPAVLVGHSFGGVTAMAVAAQAPEIVRALVIYETSLSWAPGWDDTIMSAILASDDPEEAGLRLMLGSTYADLAGAERARRHREGRAFIAEEKSVRSGGTPFDLARITCPVLYGRSDPSIMPDVVDFLRNELTSFEVDLLPGAGHYAHRADPEAFAGLIRRGMAMGEHGPASEYR